MGKRDFLDNLRLAGSLFANARLATDSRHLDPTALARAINRAAIWLTPRATEGFDEADFAELGSTGQQELASSVRKFESVARLVPSNGPATDAQVKEGGEVLQQILGILANYLPTHDEERQIRNALAKVDYPSWVRNWNFEPASNEDGEPSVSVTLYIDEAAIPPEQLGERAIEMLPRIRAALKAAGVRRSPYLRIWTAHEYQTQP